MHGLGCSWARFRSKRSLSISLEAGDLTPLNVEELLQVRPEDFVSHLLSTQQLPVPTSCVDALVLLSDHSEQRITLKTMVIVAWPEEMDVDVCDVDLYIYT